MSNRGVVESSEYNGVKEGITACWCGHAKLAHNYSKDECAVEDCECLEYRSVTDLPGEKEAVKEIDMVIETLTFGTQPSTVPLPKGYRLKFQVPLIFEKHFDGTHIIECPLFDEYGYGENYEEALGDLGSSIVDLWKSLKRLKKRRKNLGEPLRRVFDNLEGYVIANP